MDYRNVAENLRESFRIIAASRRAGELRELHGVSIASAGSTFQMFNAAFLSDQVASVAELSKRILLPTVHFNARGLESAISAGRPVLWLAAVLALSIAVTR